jgi:hypothetical protein
MSRAVQCKATANRTGQRCRRLAILGGSVCISHGGRARQVREAALRRLALADAVAAADHRSPGEILLSTLHVADVMLRQALADADAQLTPEQLSSLVGHLERAQSFARSVLSAGVEERQQRLAEQLGAHVIAILDAVLADLDLSAEQRERARTAKVHHLQLAAKALEAG